MTIVNELINGYKLNQITRLITPRVASRDQLLQFHSGDYLDHLEATSEDDENIRPVSSIGDNEEDSDDYGLAYDCPPFPKMSVYAKAIVGSTISAAEALNKGDVQVAINWGGGWHHAKRDEASGFCYLNDVVYGVLKLRERFTRVLYIDLDLHHGDGVQEAFELTNKVMTVSFHHFNPGFFPGTGGLEEIGSFKGKYCNVNVPLAAGINDAMFVDLFTRILGPVLARYRPEAIVCQCGADGLATDLKIFNLTLEGYGGCLQYLLASGIPLLLLGGGGYNFVETAKLWTFLTSLACGMKLDVNIPDNRFFDQYGPDFTLSVDPSLMANENSKEMCDDLVCKIENMLTNLQV